MRQSVQRFLVLSFAPLLALAAPALAGGPGAGAGGVGAATNPFVGTWEGFSAGPTGLGHFRYDFRFNSDFTFTLTEIDTPTSVATGIITGTYSLGGVGRNGLPLITMASGRKVVLQEEYILLPGFEIELQGTIFIAIQKVAR
jgi:hypothetical protein